MLRKIFIASRPWSFPVSALPVILGALVAYVSTQTFKPVLFSLTLVGSLMLHASANYINTWGDFKSGVDTKESAFKAPELVNNILSERLIHGLGISLMGVVALIVVILAQNSTPWLYLLSVVGMLGAYCYTAGPLPYKYQGLGSIIVFILMGVCIVLGSYMVQTGSFSWLPVFVSLPPAFIVSAILHGNDLRDRDYDTSAHIRTFANLLSYNAAYNWMRFLYISSIISLIALITFKVITPVAALALVCSLPLWIKLLKTCSLAQSGQLNSQLALEGASAQFYTMFTTAYILSILIGLIML